MRLFLFLALLISIALLSFAVQNSDVIAIKFLSLRFEGSLALVLVVVFASGFLSGILMSLPSIWRKSLALREQNKKVRQLEEKMTKGASEEKKT